MTLAVRRFRSRVGLRGEAARTGSSWSAGTGEFSGIESWQHAARGKTGQVWGLQWWVIGHKRKQWAPQDNGPRRQRAGRLKRPLEACLGPVSGVRDGVSASASRQARPAADATEYRFA